MSLPKIASRDEWMAARMELLAREKERTRQSDAHVRDTTFAAVSRAPFDKLEDYRERKGWEFPWYSSNGSRFNYDFHATIDESVAPLKINYRTRSDIERPEGAAIAWAATTEQPFEMPGSAASCATGTRCSTRSRRSRVARRRWAAPTRSWT